jgi:hypothetical protein
MSVLKLLELSRCLLVVDVKLARLPLGTLVLKIRVL